MTTTLAGMMERVKHRGEKVTARYARAISAVMALSLIVGAAPTSAQAQGGVGEILYSSSRPITGTQIYAIEPDGSKETCLTSFLYNGFCYSPAASYDGKKIAFSASFDGNRELYLGDAEGNNFKQLTNDTEDKDLPSLNQDGSKITFMSRRLNTYQGIFVMDADGTHRTLLSATGRYPLFSPDGHKIAYTVSNRDVTGNLITGIYTMNLDGSNQTLLTEGKGLSGPLAFSPDGRRIALSGSTDASLDIYVMSASGSTPVRLTHSPAQEYEPSFSPDGRQIAFTVLNNGIADIYVMNVDGSNVKRLTTQGFNTDPYWSVGTTPARTLSIENVGVSEGNTGSVPMEFIVRLSRVSSQPVTVHYETTDQTADSIPNTMSADYKAASGLITFAPGQTMQTITVAVNSDTEIEPNETLRVVLAEARGAAIKVSTAIGTILNDDPSVQATGKIAFTSSRDGNSEIYIMNADGSNQTRLTYEPGGDFSPKLSRDGTEIVFTSDRDAGNDEIYSMNADGSDQKQLTNNGANDAAASFSPDGRKIVFTSDRNGTPDIYVMNADGSGQARLTTGTTIELYPQFSPDGRKIIYSGFEPALSNEEIYIMNADGSGQTLLTIGPAIDFLPTFSPDGRKIVFTSSRDGLYRIFSMNSDGSNVVSLSNTTAYGYLPYDTNPDYSPDGHKIAFTFNRNNNLQIYVMDENGANRIQLTSEGGNSGPSWGPGSVPTPSPRVFFSSAKVAEGNSGSKTMLFTATLSQSSKQSVAVNYTTLNDTALAGSDYGAVKGTLIFNPGQTRLTVPVVVKGDTLPEGNEAFFVQAVSARGAIIANRGTGTILNDDEAALSIVLSSSRVIEGPTGEVGHYLLGRVTRNVQINRDTPALTVNLYATPSNQTVQPISIVIPAATASSLFQLYASEDDIVEATRLVTITALAPGYKRASANLTVLDNDRPVPTHDALAASSITLSTAQIANDIIRLTFTGPLNTEALEAENFEITRNGQSVAVQSVSFSNGAVVIALPSGSTKPGDTLLLRYHNLRGAEGGSLADGEVKLVAR